MSSSIQDRVNARLANVKRNMHHQSSGAPAIAAGNAFLRLIGVVEIGIQQTSFKGNPIRRPMVKLTYEISGSQWPQTDGRLPLRTETMTNSDNARAELYKLMSRLDPDEEYSHIGQLLGRVLFGEISHRQNNDRTYIDLENICLPLQKNPRTGAVEDLSSFADDQIAPSMFFLWDHPEISDWDGLYIPGEYDDGGSRNAFQQSIRSALNFEGSPIYNLLKQEGADPWEDFDPVKQVAIAGSAPKNRAAALAYQSRFDRRNSDANSPASPPPRRPIGAAATGTGRGRPGPDLNDEIPY